MKAVARRIGTVGERYGAVKPRRAWSRRIELLWEGLIFFFSGPVVASITEFFITLVLDRGTLLFATHIHP